MTTTYFREATEKYLDYFKRIKEKSFDESLCKGMTDKEAQEIEETEQSELRSIINGMELNFPKKPTALDSFYMFEGYRYLMPDSLSESERRRWLQHTKKFLKTTKDNNINVRDETFDKIITCIPDMTSDAREVFGVSLNVYKRISKGYAHKRSCLDKIEKRAENGYNAVLCAARQVESDEEKESLYKAATVIADYVPAYKRMGSVIECYNARRPLQKSQYDKDRLERSRALHIAKVSKTQPLYLRNRQKARQYELR